MAKENKFLIFFVILLVAVAFLWLGWRTGFEKGFETGQADILEQIKQASEVAEPEEISINIIIEGFFDEGIDMEIEPEATALGLLEKINQENPSFNLQTKTYEGLGVLVEGMGEKVNGQDNKYWQYYVNGQMPMVGADQYVLKDNDKVEWVFAESEF